MGRPAKLWFRKDRNAWHATIHGKKVNFGPDHEKAEREFHRRKSLDASSPNISRLTTGALIDLYLDWAKPRVKDITWESYRRTLQEFIDWYDNVRACDLRAYHLTKWIEEHPTWNVSSQHLAIAVVKIWNRWCIAQGYLDVNRLAMIKAPKMRSRIPAPPGDLERLLGAVDNRDFRNFLVVLLDTGCRPGEIRSLAAAQKIGRAHV